MYLLRSDIQNPFVLGGNLVFCALFVLPPIAGCNKLAESLYAVKIEGGAILSATWSTAWSPTIKAATDYYLQ